MTERPGQLSLVPAGGYSDTDKQPASNMGPYLATRDGHLVYLLHPRVEDFDPVRTARTLSYEHRYVGNVGSYSVAQHAVLVADVVDRLLCREPEYVDDPAASYRLELAGLHHDDVEYITGDMPQPVKQLFPEFKRFEQTFVPALQERYGIDISHPAVAEADRIVFCAEVRMLTPRNAHAAYGEFGNPEYRRDVQPDWGEVVPWTPEQAFARYMSRHEALTERLAVAGRVRS